MNKIIKKITTRDFLKEAAIDLAGATAMFLMALYFFDALLDQAAR